MNPANEEILQLDPSSMDWVNSQRITASGKMAMQVPKSIFVVPRVFATGYATTVLDWSSTDIIALATENQLLYSRRENPVNIRNATRVNSERVLSLKFSDDGNKLAVVANKKNIKIFDVNNLETPEVTIDTKQMATTISWTGSTLLVGLFGGEIYEFDPRSSVLPMNLSPHNRQVLSIECNKLGYNIASASADSSAFVWDRRLCDPDAERKLPHDGLVKALAWSPAYSDLLASGEYFGNHQLRLWNTSLQGSEEPEKIQKTNGSISSLQWVGNGSVLYSTHMKNDRTAIWSMLADTFTYAGKLRGHRNGVVNSAVSPDGTDLLTLSTDGVVVNWSLV